MEPLASLILHFLLLVARRGTSDLDSPGVGTRSHEKSNQDQILPLVMLHFGVSFLILLTP